MPDELKNHTKGRAVDRPAHNRKRGERGKASAREIGQHNQEETALRESQQIIRAILDTVPARIFWKNKDLIYLGCNEPFARDAGFTCPEDVIGKDDYQMGWHEQADQYRKDDREVIDTGLSKLLIKEPQTTPEGKTIALLTSKVPLRKPDGEIFGVLGTYMDVTERDRMEEALKQSETRFRAIFDKARDGIALLDLQTKKVFAGNPSFCRMLGRTSDELPGLSLADCHPADALPEIARGIERQIKGETNIASDLPMKRKDGSTFFADLAITPIALSGKPYMLGIFRDVSERKAAEDKLKFANMLLQAEIESAPDGVFVAHLDSATASYNRNFVEMLSIPPEVERSHSIEAVLAAAMTQVKDPDAFTGDIHHLREHPEDTIRGREAELKDGRVIEYHGTAIRSETGAALGRIWFYRDITERKRAEQHVRVMNSILNAQVESAPDGVLVIGHERNILLYNQRFIDMWGLPADVVRMRDDSRAIASVLGRLKDPEAFVARVNELYAHPEERSHDEVDLSDGRVFERHSAPMPDATGKNLGRIWYFRDITDRKLAARRIEQRDALLHAVALSATHLLSAPRLDEAIASALESVSKVIRADRMMVLERPQGRAGAPALRYIWETPRIAFKVDKDFFDDPTLETDEMRAWQAPLRQGKVIITDVQTASGDVKAVLGRLGGIKKNLLVPIMVGGKFWGQIGVDCCDQEQAWADFEIEILQTLADLIGNAIQRDRYITEITNANRIVQNTPTILYRLRGVPTLPMIYISQNAKLFGYEPAMLTESPTLYQSLFHPDDAIRVRDDMAAALEPDRPRGTFEFRLLTSSGNYRWVENRYTQIRDGAGRLVEIEGLLIDVTERKAAEERIALLARTDPLTGLANRTTFIERLRQAFVAARRGAPSFALHYIDLDRFKDINDTLGHPVGDRFLIEMGDRIKQCLRESDLVGRLGGDEFAVLQTDISVSTDAGTLANKIRAALAEPLRLDGNLLHMTASVGIAIYGAETPTPEDLLAQADIALYRAKEEGRDQYRFHTEQLDIEVREQVALADELREAIARKELRLHFQPQVELSTGRIVGMEALVRWQHPNRGLLSPSTFIPVAERTGTIAEIGQWVLDHACEQMHLWREAGCAPAIVAVNVSPVEIKVGEDYIKYVTTTLSKWQLAPSDLEIDVTESTLARATLAQNDVLERLQKLGVKISIDDFGTKYSSLDYLKTYRVNRLKIPRTLTAAAAHNAESAAMVRAIVGIARELNIEVMAQGVETESQWSFLTATSPVSKVQGFYYSEPVSAKRAQELLQRGRIAPFGPPVSAAS